jgi:hypothetical protein
MPVTTTTKERVQKERADVHSTRMALNYRQMMYLVVAEKYLLATENAEKSTEKAIDRSCDKKP